jgi:dephospho-CoA kinase
MIIGITGTDGAGKGTVVRYLVDQKGFTHYSSRKHILEEIEKQGLETDRNQMRLTGNELRETFGNDVIVSKSLVQMEQDGVEHAVIESLRTVAEAETLKREGGILLAVDADQALRFQRVQERRSETDKVSFEEFVAHENLESDDPNPHGMQKKRVVEMADYTILNNGSLTELEKQTEEVLAAIGF